MLERGEGWTHCHQPPPRWAVGEAPSAPGLGINPNALNRISQLGSREQGSFPSLSSAFGIH